MTRIVAAKDYLTRNRDIGDACDLLVSAPKSKREEQRSGTQANGAVCKEEESVLAVLETVALSDSHHLKSRDHSLHGSR